MLQVELHPYLTQTSLLRTTAQYGIPVTGFSPLGASSYLELSMASEPESVLREKVVSDMADDTVSQPHRWCCAGAYSAEPRIPNPPKRLDARKTSMCLISN